MRGTDTRFKLPPCICKRNLGDYDRDWLRSLLPAYPPVRILDKPTWPEQLVGEIGASIGGR